MKTGEKMLVYYREKPFIPCDRDHPDYLLRVKHIDASLVERPAHKEKSVVLTTSDVS